MGETTGALRAMQESVHDSGNGSDVGAQRRAPRSRARKGRNEPEPVSIIRFEELLPTIFDKYRMSTRWQDPKYIAEATAATQEFDKLLKEQRTRLGTTTPIGLYSSIGQGFNVVPSSQDQEERRVPPYTALYGYVLLTNDTAKATANAFWRLQQMREATERLRFPEEVKNHPSLENLLRRNYIPIPDAIVQMPVIGPIGLGHGYDNKVSALFLSWIRGLTLHDLLPQLRNLEQKYGNQGKEFRDMAIWTPFQMIGVWQASSSVVGNETVRTGIHEMLRGQYEQMLQSPLESAELLGLNITAQDKEGIAKTNRTLANLLEIDDRNVRPYFDAAARNFVVATGDADDPADSFYNKAVVGRSVDMGRLWDITRRVDFSHVAKRPYAIDAEDMSHLIINWQSGIGEREEVRYVPVAVLTRAAIEAYNEGEVQQAAKLAEDLETLRTTHVMAGEARAVWVAYHDAHRHTIEAMPFIRTVRQAHLALHYAAKAIANESPDAAIETIKGEAASYFTAAASRLTHLQETLGSRNVVMEGIPQMLDLLLREADQAQSGSVSELKMKELGTALLNQYQ